ncbi:hypothetical protein PR048_023632 [Dryococelus australis]|uniref:Uncharacterized protein n=1 Tax=Dryococelus australis TaxID=614101 RepID=A0ABQ9GUQ5_9NEOP|nr:hypothetical protein PR048_023632 [Dryococelus australis]
MEMLFEKIRHDKYLWTVCCDLKVITLFTGFQLGYTKFCCFLCERDNRDRTNHYIKREWPKHESILSGHKNIAHSALVSSDRILLPPLHIKSGLLKNFVMAADMNSAGALFLDGHFEDFLSPIDEISAWRALKGVAQHLLGS